MSSVSVLHNVPV